MPTGQKRMLKSLEFELQAVVRCLIKMLVAKPGFLEPNSGPLEKQQVFLTSEMAL